MEDLENTAFGTWCSVDLKWRGESPRRGCAFRLTLKREEIEYGATFPVYVVGIYYVRRISQAMCLHHTRPDDMKSLPISGNFLMRRYLANHAAPSKRPLQNPCQIRHRRHRITCDPMLAGIHLRSEQTVALPWEL